MGPKVVILLRKEYSIRLYPQRESTVATVKTNFMGGVVTLIWNSVRQN
jgi:hypothetical protein